MISRSGREPAPMMSPSAVSIIASMSFMSTAPRPHSMPSRISPANGSTLQLRASAGTTSRWPCTTRAGLSGLRPGTRATTLVRRGSGSNIWGDRPSAASLASTYSAASRSPFARPSPWLVVSIRMRSRAITAVSSSSLSGCWTADDSAMRFTVAGRRRHVLPRSKRVRIRANVFSRACERSRARPARGWRKWQTR